MIEVNFDGSCEPRNPGGRMGCGFVVSKDGRRLHAGKRFIVASPDNSNNVAEYTALLDALEWLEQQGYAREQILIRGDSNLVIQQMVGRWKIKKGLYREAALAARAKLQTFPRARFRWVPRNQNAEADALTRDETISPVQQMREAMARDADR